MIIRYISVLIISLAINDLVSIEYSPVVEKIKSGTYFERLKNLIDKLSKQNDSDSSFCKVTISNDQAKVAVASGYFRSKVYLCDVGSEKITTILTKTKKITKLGFSPDSKKLVTCDEEGLIRIFDSENGNHLVSINTGFKPFRSHCFIFSASSNKIIFVNGNDISVFDINTGQLLYTLIGHTSRVQSLVLTSDDSLLASVAERDEVVYLWDMHTGKLKYTLHEEKAFFSGFDGYCSLAVNNDDSSIAAGTDEGTIYVWNLKTRKLLNTLSQGSSGVDSLIFTKNNSKLMSGSSDETVCVWDLKTNKKENVFKLSGVAEYMDDMFLSEKENKLITLHGHVINIWDINSNKTLALNTRGALNFYELYVHNNIIIGSSDESRIHLWNLDDIPMSSFYTIPLPIAEKNSTPIEYYGKNINELRAQDSDLDKAVREAFWDTKYVSFFSYFTSCLPQDRVKRMQKNLPIIEKMIEVLKKQIASNEGVDKSTRIDSGFSPQKPNDIMSLLIFFPWVVLGELMHSHIKSQAKKRLNVSKKSLSYLYKVQENLLQTLDICDRYGKDAKVLK